MLIIFKRKPGFDIIIDTLETDLLLLIKGKQTHLSVAAWSFIFSLDYVTAVCVSVCVSVFIHGSSE